MIKSENEGEIIPPSEELGEMGEAARGCGAGDEPRVAGPSPFPRPQPNWGSIVPFHSQSFLGAQHLYTFKIETVNVWIL